MVHIRASGSHVFDSGTTLWHWSEAGKKKRMIEL
jgi:hypothetical protein